MSGDKRQVAIIDLGSNTARMVAMEYVPGHSYRLLDELRQVVRLYEGMPASGSTRLQEPARFRALNALRTFAAYARAAGINDVIATATSAVRDASNGPEFLDEVERETGLRLTVLDADQEAAAGVLAVTNSFPVEDALMLDIGGGSAQLAVMQGRAYQWGRSFPLGAVRVTEEFIRKDPPGSASIRKISQHVRGLLKGIRKELDGSLPLYGMGGTIRNLADVHQERTGHPLGLLHGHRLSLDTVEAEVEEFAEMSLAERRRIAGLNSDRADIIIAGAVVAREFMKAAGTDHLTVSGQGLRDGLFYPRLFPDVPGHLAPDVRGFSVMNLVRHYLEDEPHALHVRHLSLSLFDQLQQLHGLGAWERELLGAAALLHDIGIAVNYFEHHKHSAFLIRSSGLPGFTHREIALIALMTYYHRKSRPSFQDLGLLLRKGDQTRLEVLCGILRVSEYLERSKSRRVTDVRVDVLGDVVGISALSRGDAFVEVSEAQARSDLLAMALGRPVTITEVL